VIKFVRFGIVGSLGVLVDLAILYPVAKVINMTFPGAGLLAGQVCAWFGAATFTWYCNRRFTFALTTAPTVREWLAFLLANSFGGLVNYAIYAALIVTLSVVAAHPFLGVAAGAIGGLVVNFAMSSRFVFAKKS